MNRYRLFVILSVLLSASLLYASEENYHCRDYEIHTVASNGDYYFYDGSSDAVDGKLNADIITNNLPESVELLMTYRLAKLFGD